MDNLADYATKYLEQKERYHSRAFTEDFVERACIMADSLEHMGVKWICYEAYKDLKLRGKQ